MYMTPCTVLQNINVSAAFPLVVFQYAFEFQLFFLTAPMFEIQLHCDSGLSLCNFHCCYIIVVAFFWKLLRCKY